MKNLPHVSKLSSLKDWALFYASRNIPLIPLHSVSSKGQCTCQNDSCRSPGKHPRVKNGLKDATLDSDLIEKWWGNWPCSNIGLLTGTKSGLLVLDIDPRHDGDSSLKIWKKKYPEFSTSSVTTGGNGKHFYFSYPQKEKLRNKVNILPGIDVRAEGGYIVAPPSIHATGNHYKWDTGQQQVGDTPSWLIKEISNKPLPRTGSSNLIIPGLRNNFLTSIAGSLRKYGFSFYQIEKELGIINDKYCGPSLDFQEISKIAKSISSYNTNEALLSKINWEEIKEIPENTYKISNMDESFLPQNLKIWIYDIAERMQVPLEFIATPVIVSLSSIIGRKVGVFPKKNDNWLVIPNLWGGIVAGPGCFKTPSISEAIKPIEKLVEIENEKYAQKKKEWEADKSINEATISAIKEQLVKAIKKNSLDDVSTLSERMKKLQIELEDNRPINKRLKTNDATVEKLSQLLIENSNGLLVIRDELAGWLSSLNKFGRDGDREFYLESWNGHGSYTVDRIGRGTIHVPALCLSIFGGIQPDKLKQHLTQNLETNSDGLLQRFQMMIYPKVSKEWKNIDRSPNFKAQEEVFQLYRKIFELKSQSQDEEISGIRFSDEAQEVFNEWRKNLELHLRSETIVNSHYEAHVSKYRSLLPSLAVIFHLIDQNSNEINLNKKISLKSLKMAIKWCNFLDEHAQKIYQINSFEYYHSVQAFISKIKEEKIKDGDNLRSIYRHNWKHLNSAEKIENAISYLSNYNWICIEESERKFKNVRILRINPSISFKGGKNV